MAQERLLTVNQLRTEFMQGKKSSVTAINEISFHIDKGEILGLVGESGCGKSVTSLSIMRLLNFTSGKITKGEVIFDGKDMLKLNDKEIREIRGGKMSMIFQEPMSSLNPAMRIDKQMIEGIRLHTDLSKAEARQRAAKILAQVGIPDPERVLKNYPHQLSGGMSQRVMIAMAMSCNPQLLIADEPTTALDVTIQAQIMDLMRELKEKMNTAIILVTHDLGVVANFADRIQVMYAGQVVERGTAREIFYDSKHPYTWALLSSVPKLAKEAKQELYALKGTPPDLILPLNCCPFASRCEYCMPICKERNPFETAITDTHKVSCWLQHPNAPKVKSFYDREVQ